MKLDLTGLDTVTVGDPVLADQVVFARISSAVLKDQKADPSRKNLVVVMKILNEKVIDTENNEIAPGNMSLFYQFSMAPNPEKNYNPVSRVKELLIACGYKNEHMAEIMGSDDEFQNHIIGKDVKAKIRYRAPEGNYAERHDVHYLNAIRESDNFTPPA